jgi:hypothetical protein
MQLHIPCLLSSGSLELDFTVEFASEDWDLAGGTDADADGTVLDPRDHDFDVVSDHDGFTDFTS